MSPIFNTFYTYDEVSLFCAHKKEIGGNKYVLYIIFIFLYFWINSQCVFKFEIMFVLGKKKCSKLFDRLLFSLYCAKNDNKIYLIFE